jgi:hypothetical protein
MMLQNTNLIDTVQHLFGGPPELRSPRGAEAPSAYQTDQFTSSVEAHGAGLPC